MFLSLIFILFAPNELDKLIDYFFSFGNPVFYVGIIVTIIYAIIVRFFRKDIIPFEQKNHNQRKTYRDIIDDEITSMLNLDPDPAFRFNSMGILKHFNHAAKEIFPTINHGEHLVTSLFPSITATLEDIFKNYQTHYFIFEHKNKKYTGRFKASTEFKFAVIHLRDSTSYFRYEREYETIHSDIIQIRTHLLTRLESEKKRIASELHDSVGQVFSAAKLHIGRLEEIQDDERVKDVYEKSMYLLGNGISELKDITYRLRPKVLEEMGLVAALKALVSRMDTKGKITGTFDSYGDFSDLDETLEIALYRMAQEGISNIVKHSFATKFSIQLLNYRGEIKLLINDNGVGFKLEDALNKKEKKKTMGLMNMIERVKLFNGFFDFDTFVDKGTYITLVIPIENNKWIPVKQ